MSDRSMGPPRPVPLPPPARPALPSVPAASGPALRLHVDTLVVPAASLREGGRVGAGLRAELSRLLAAGPRPSEPIHLESLRTEPLRLRPREDAERAGARLARVIAASLGRLP